MPAIDAGIEVDAGADAGGVDAGEVDAGTKADHCASTFGAAFTTAFGRADGTITAVVSPNVQCPLPNDDHLVIQISIDGGIQRVVVNVKSDFGDPKVRLRELTAPLPTPVFEEGWHPGLALDFPTTLGVHSDAGWDVVDLETASARLYDALTVGAPLSVYGSSDSYPESMHKIHRNGRNTDGAIVINPTSASPQWMIFSFQTQTF